MLNHLSAIGKILYTRQKTNSKPKNRNDKYHVSLIIEGGNMRGAISGGMINAIEKLGYTNCFDSVYGSSAGTMAAAYLLSSKAYLGAPLCYQNASTDNFISFKNLLKGKPFANLTYLTHNIMNNEKPVKMGDIKRLGVDFHPVVSCCKTGKAKSLRPRTQKELLDAIHASAKIPFFSGGPAKFRGDEYFDACVTVPYAVELALKNGATHVLVLRMDRNSDKNSGIIGKLMKLGVRLYSKILAKNYICHSAASKALELKNVETIYPAQTISSLEKNIHKLHKGAMHGIHAVYTYFNEETPQTYFDENDYIRIK